MPRSDDAPPLLKLPLDRFLYRLLGAISLGIALLLGAFAANQAFQRIPIAMAVKSDHGIDSVGRAGELLFAYQYVSLGVAAVALVVSLLAFAWVNRTVLTAAFLCNFAAAAATVGTEVALSRVWTWLTTSLRP